LIRNGIASFRKVLIKSPDRYWGASSPYPDLTAETLQYLNLEQSIEDLVHFAKTVNLPFDSDHSSNADNAVSRASEWTTTQSAC
jgi:hypothetical protein